MYIQNYEDNYKLMWDGLECKNDKPISCYSGAASGAVIMGWTVARFLEESVEGTKVAISMLDKLQEAAGPIHALNYAPAGLNNAIVLCKLWNSRVLLPGRELPETPCGRSRSSASSGPRSMTRS